ncbi:MAG: AAA family ATPase, partial [Bacteroidetes bacterium]|nr:AAA family ATPase [Bacteroidota bacterium]
MIKRQAEWELLNLARQFKAVAMIGPRQSGKTTLAKHAFAGKAYVNLENPDNRQFATEDPRGFLNQYASGAILDEVQRVPSLFSYLQQVLDDDPKPGKFILTGSNNFLLQENISQSLAGRIAYLILLPFAASEIPDSGSPYDIMQKGLYPPVYDQPVDANTWYSP